MRLATAVLPVAGAATSSIHNNINRSFTPPFPLPQVDLGPSARATIQPPTGQGPLPIPVPGAYQYGNQPPVLNLYQNPGTYHVGYQPPFPPVHGQYQTNTPPPVYSPPPQRSQYHTNPPPSEYQTHSLQQSQYNTNPPPSEYQTHSLQQSQYNTNPPPSEYQTPPLQQSQYNTNPPPSVHQTPPLQQSHYVTNPPPSVHQTPPQQCHVTNPPPPVHHHQHLLSTGGFTHESTAQQSYQPSVPFQPQHPLLSTVGGFPGGPTAQQQESQYPKQDALQSQITTGLWVPDNRSALIITMSKYNGKFTQLSAPPNDGQAIYDFLCNHCSFPKNDVQWIKEQNQTKEIDEAFAKLHEQSKQAKDKGKLLIFIYYSGHGSFDSKNGKTGGHLLNGDPFDLELRLDQLKSQTNTTVIALFDCCREERKGLTLPPTPVEAPGQLTTIHAVPIGAFAAGATGRNAVSNATKTFLSVMYASNDPFPQCISTYNETTKSAASLIVTQQMKYQVVLKKGADRRLAEKAFNDWDVEEVINWLSTLKIQTPDYTVKIRDGGFNGHYFEAVLFNSRETGLFLQIFDKQADINLVALDMERILKRKYF